MNKIKYTQSSTTSELDVVSVSLSNSVLTFIAPIGNGPQGSYPTVDTLKTLLSSLYTFEYGYKQNNIWTTYAIYNNYSKIASVSIKYNQLIDNVRTDVAIFTLNKGDVFNIIELVDVTTDLHYSVGIDNGSVFIERTN